MIVPSDEISIVIQGPLYLKPKSSEHIGIEQSLSVLKEVFPLSEIIISTWENEDIRGLNADKIIQSVDPGAFDDINQSNRNLNRQILSTYSGIKAATRKYVLKTRSDLLIKSNDIAQVIAAEPNAILKSKVTMTSMVTRNHYKVPFLFHASDVVQFGLREDISNLWDVPLEANEKEIIANKWKNFLWRNSSSQFKFFPEQALVLYWLRKHGYTINLTTPSEISFSNFVLWERILYENFYILDYKKSNIEFPIHFYTSVYKDDTLLSSADVSKTKGQLDSSYRYLHLLSSKYILCFFRKVFWLSLGSHLIYLISPSLHQYAYSLYRKKRPR